MSRMRTSGCVILAALASAGLGFANPAAAASMTPQQQADFKRNCTGDYMRLCSDYEPDAPQTQQCFQQKMRQVSARCRATIQTFQRGG